MRSSHSLRPDALLLCALVGLAAVLRVALIHHGSFDLRPRPDALEYSAVARQLAQGEGLSFSIDGHDYPSRYPYGTSLVLLPAVWLAGGDPAFGFAVILLLGCVSVAMVYRLAREAGGPVAAATAALVLAVCPRHATLSTLPLSEIPSTFFSLAIALLFLRWWRGRRWRGPLFGLGLLLAFSASIRWPNLLVGVPIGLLLLAGSREDRRGLAVLVAGLAAGLFPEFLYREAFFGSPFRTGYHFWEPDAYESWRTSYNPSFLIESARPEWLFGNLSFYARGLSGYTPALLTPVTAVLALLGAVLLGRELRRRSAHAWLVVATPLLTALFYLPYFFRDQRMNVPTVAYLGVLAGVGVERLLGPLRGVRRGLLGLLLAAGLVFGVGFGTDPLGVAGELARNLQGAAASRNQALAPILREVGPTLPPGALLISDVAQLLLQSYLPEGTEVLGLGSDLTNEDEEVRLLHLHGQPDLDGHVHPPRTLFRGDAPDEAVFEYLEAEAARGREIQMWIRQTQVLYRFAPVISLRFEHEDLTERDGPSTLLRRGRLRFRP